MCFVCIATVKSLRQLFDLKFVFVFPDLARAPWSQLDKDDRPDPKGTGPGIAWQAVRECSVTDPPALQCYSSASDC